MNGAGERSAQSGRRTLFYRDLASPVSSHRGKLSSPGQAAAVSALWRENFSESELPPPPAFTLDDRSEFSPESGLADWPVSPEPKSDAKKTPPFGSPFLLRGRAEASSSSASFAEGSPLQGEKQQQQQQQHQVLQPISPSSSWWSPSKSGVGEQESKEKGSPVNGVVLPGALITLPPPREVARPELRSNALPLGDIDEEQWVTVYGFPPCDTNSVLREFEKCGVILRHVPGPGDANWMHILYQNRHDAQKALLKNGTLLSGLLIVGVKPVEASQRIFLDEKGNGNGQAGFMVSLPAQVPTRRGTVAFPPPATGGSGGESGLRHQGGGAIASPAKSVVSKIMDLMFGI